MYPALIAGEIVNAMRHDHASGQTGKIMIKGFARLLAVDFTIAVERSQDFLFLGIDTQDRVASLEKRLDDRGQMVALGVAMW